MPFPILKSQTQESALKEQQRLDREYGGKKGQENHIELNH